MAHMTMRSAMPADDLRFTIGDLRFTIEPELRNGHLLPVVGQASCLSIAAKKLREIFAGLFAGHGRLEACPTNQRRFDFGVRVEEKHGAASAALANRKS
jgi:hypothetical protein